jgi:NAD(P)-dependent dehydrogenase (short-subunit alcohol dehydrogenase family)
VKRLAASMVIAAREHFKRKQCRAAAVAAARRYREAMLAFAQVPELDVWYSHLDVSSAIAQWAGLAGEKAVKQLQKSVAKARQKDSARAYRQLVHEVGGRVAFVSDPPLIVPLDELTTDHDQTEDARAFLDSVVRTYRSTLNNDRSLLLDRFELVDVARKVVGVGSVGTRCWMALFLGRYRSDPLVLQCKEAQASVLEPYAGKSRYGNSGQRVVEGQRFMQAASDILLGWAHVKRGLDGGERDFYVRQLWDGKFSAQVEAFTPQLLSAYGEMCGWTLARAHARSGDRIAIAGYLGTSPEFEEALGAFAEEYADQNDRDYVAFKAATVSSGTHATTSGNSSTV